jgi:hypothetical protein
VHTPFWHASACVQRFPSLHWVPSVTGVCAEHTPVLVLQEPATWHESVAGGQMTGLEPTHEPAWHA